jgi:hypothetical protein
LSLAHSGQDTLDVNTLQPFILVLILCSSDRFPIKVFCTVCLTISNFLGENSLRINTVPFISEKLVHLYWNSRLFYLKASNGIVWFSNRLIDIFTLLFSLTSAPHLFNKFRLPFTYRRQEGRGCFHWETVGLFTDYGKFKGNIYEACNTILGCNFNLAWFDHPGPSSIFPFFKICCVPLDFLEYVSSLVASCYESAGMIIPFFNGRFNKGCLNCPNSRDGIMSEWNKEDVFITVEFDHSHKSFEKIVQIFPIFKFPNGDVFMIKKEVFTNMWGDPPGVVFLHVFEPTYEMDCIFHHYLISQRGLGNLVLKIPNKTVTNPAGMLLYYDSVSIIAENCTGVVLPLDMNDKFLPSGFCGNDVDHEANGSFENRFMMQVGQKIR